MGKNKFGKWEFTDAEVERQFEEATKRGKESIGTEPRAESAYFDQNSNLVMVRFTNGCIFGFPPNLVRELKDAATGKIEEVEITPQGTGLCWESLDADYSVAGLLSGVFGTKAWVKEFGKRGGKVKSRAKSEAARINGAKGGRPRKHKIEKSKI